MTGVQTCALPISSYLAKPKFKKYIILFLLFVFPFIGLSLISGDVGGLVYVETNVWGGLALTLIVSIFAIIFCFPIGVMLAMGRRSELCWACHSLAVDPNHNQQSVGQRSSMTAIR